MREKHTYRKPKVAFKMNETTFDAMNKGEIGGFGAWIKGQLKVDGSFMTAMKWDKMLRRYNPDETYTKKTPTG